MAGLLLIVGATQSSGSLRLKPYVDSWLACLEAKPRLGFFLGTQYLQDDHEPQWLFFWPFAAGSATCLSATRSLPFLEEGFGDLVQEGFPFHGSPAGRVKGLRECKSEYTGPARSSEWEACGRPFYGERRDTRLANAPDPTCRPV